MNEFNLYVSFDSWYREKPDAVIKGNMVEKNEKYIEILDSEGYTQIFNLDKIFSITYKKGEYLY
ncbi:hypothetical protein IAI10_19660 [Clostridium sp. 19966]|uniref:hypothetical protein n=1 Tax=Clostridium sp. 19966 TaxID=2768166 RepID=UPI0028DE4A2A|nr:hypothetical protein [Clostridium sp. 19966]MDT8718875.1 hypothetical protein [Clostridium sp. 19966]